MSRSASTDLPRSAPGVLLGVAGVLVAVAWVARSGPRHGMLVAGPAGALALLLLARRAGLSATDLGLARAHWRRGALYAAGCAVVVALGYAVALAVPPLRSGFLDERYRTDLTRAVVTAFVTVPLGTVLFEEVAFRGVLWAALRPRGPAVATAVSALLFGCWHILPSLRLNRVNPAVAEVAGSGRAGQVLAVAGAVLFTGLAGALLCELRRRSGSLLAPLGLHWSVNGFAVLVAAALAR